ncbi:MAG TPA: 2-amino-4-hydroxy-6-hydroxymethyldihydropteridine diphosphokinase [Armatimonadota bacterium]|nr:2-amino-4-hydroxy-6-hydroxymethyldihydropteridine diphosphokinase [Armatimonadota bacterium]HOS43744.1 2-amino-4-hydroxy-6-hydroxymethyldihydropteridine diphosphokinase [Armatimonadota bacterium]
MPTAYLAIGSNIDADANLRRGLALLARAVRVRALSTLYRTPALGRPDDPPFVNGVAEIATTLPPRALKMALRRIEAALGRRRSAEKCAPRVLDLDIIWYDDISDARYPLPDPEIPHRPFLAIPLAELAPTLALPDGTLLRDLADELRGAPMTPLPALTDLLRKDLEDEHHARGRTDS